ncbi:MAG TPA: SpoIIE family protein phosphatase [Kofleriaceae bacterium]|nr:SpoIIE family protein phosphatase [Kofleriaceae bacterium]
MSELSWSWLCAPYVACAVGMVAVALVGALVRGDRVMRVGMIGAPVTALPWAVCSAVAACTHDPELATRLLRLGNGPIAFVGPHLMLVLLGVSGQLERYRWVARISGVVGVVLLAICWGTTWTVPGVHLVPAGIYYVSAGPTTGIHLMQLGLWLGVGLVIARRAAPTGERKSIVRILIGVLALGTIGATDLLLVYGVWGYYPIAWLPALVACVLALYLVGYTDLLRPQGIDRTVAVELVGFALALVAVAAIAFASGAVSPLLQATIGAAVWIVATALAWGFARQRVAPVRDHRALDELLDDLVDLDDEAKIASRLAELWKAAIGIAVTRTWIAEGELLVSRRGDRVETWRIDAEVATWLVVEAEPIAVLDLATMRLGAQRTKIEAFASTHGAQLIVPLLDRGTLVGLVEGNYDRALREDERGLVADSARAVARALTYAGLARSAARERETAREVEVAEAMRLVAAASRDDELGRWAVAAEYRSAPRTTGASWSAMLLGDGRLAVIVTEAQAHGVAAALATAALTGAFAAATSGGSTSLDELIANLRTSAEGVVRAGEPVAAFVAIVDAKTEAIEWASAGHPGGHLMTSIAFDLATTGSPIRPPPIPIATPRGRAPFANDSMLVVASIGLRGKDDEEWAKTIRVLAAAGSRLPALAIDAVSKTRALDEDWLAIVVRHRADRPSEPAIG